MDEPEPEDGENEEELKDNSVNGSNLMLLQQEVNFESIKQNDRDNRYDSNQPAADIKITTPFGQIIKYNAMKHSPMRQQPYLLDEEAQQFKFANSNSPMAGHQQNSNQLHHFNRNDDFSPSLGGGDFTPPAHFSMMLV